LNQFRICGPANSISVDVMSGTVIRHVSGSYKSYLTYLVPPIVMVREYLRNARRNAVEIFTQRLHQDSGMKELVERFYGSITARSAPPISYRDILLTARVMDAIFAQIRVHADPPAIPAATRG
jgi:hypothetical protein